MTGSSMKPAYLPHPVSGRTEDLEGGLTSQVTAPRQACESSRAVAVQNVQRSVNQLAQMFRKMADVVVAQDELVRRIDMDIGATGENVEKAQMELSRYMLHIKSNRGLILKVFLILLCFTVFFVV